MNICRLTFKYSLSKIKPHIASEEMKEVRD